MLSHRLRELRLSKDLSLEQLATQVGSTKSYIWELEKKDDIKPSADIVSKLALALGVTVGHLLGQEPNDEDMVFFREYKALDNQTKSQLQNILQALKKSG